MHPTDDLRIRAITRLSTPAEVMRDCAATDTAMATVDASRQVLHDILAGGDDRLAVVIGPCSIHDTRAALEYAARLVPLRRELGDALEIVMRVYFEKPRTTVGWKGLINDPDLDGSFHIDKGLRLARGLLRDIYALGVPAGCEFLDMITPQYIADLVDWGAIGARTTESQVHREMASGLSCPIGFKNGTDGNVKIAVDAVQAASQPHHFMAVTKDGQAAVAATRGNGDCHVILRGGKQPNYHASDVAAAAESLSAFNLPEQLVIDFSHGNCLKQHRRQMDVAAEVAEQIKAGSRAVAGVMIESFLEEGNQKVVSGEPLVYGKSITDPCLGWQESEKVLALLAEAVSHRL